jgi:hypothetical protein
MEETMNKAELTKIKQQCVIISKDLVSSEIEAIIDAATNNAVVSQKEYDDIFVFMEKLVDGMTE